MAMHTLKHLVSPDGRCRVLIVQRPDGVFSYQFQFLEETQTGAQWGAPGPCGGLYDSAETAEQEARARLAAKLI
jgi:hypothetical protein